MKNLPLLAGTIITTVVLVIGVAVFFSNESNQGPPEPVFVDEGIALGNMANVKGATESAQIRLIEFSDFQCPACASSEPFVKQVMDQYSEDVVLVYRHYPLDAIHPNAREAAWAAEAAASFGKFWEMHGLLFERQNEWARISDNAELYEYFANLAEELEIDKTAFLERMDSDAVREQVDRDVADGTQVGVNSTPTFYLNGQQVSAPQLLSAVAVLVESQTQSAPEEATDSAIASPSAEPALLIETQ